MKPILQILFSPRDFKSGIKILFPPGENFIPSIQMSALLLIV